MKNITDIMERLTKLKAESIQDGKPFGNSSADKEIKAIDEVLQVFGVNHLHKQTVAEHAFFWPVRTIQETLSAQRVISHLKRKSQKPSIHADY